MRWFFPDDETRPHACAALFGLFAEQYLATGRVDVVPTVAGHPARTVAAHLRAHPEDWAHLRA